MTDEQIEQLIEQLKLRVGHHDAILQTLAEWLKRVSGAVEMHTKALEGITALMETDPAARTQ